MQKPIEHLKGFEETIWMFHKQYPEKPHLSGYIYRHLSLQKLA